MRKRRYYFFIFIAVAISYTIGVLIGEFALRVVTPPWLARRMEELNVGSASHFGADSGWPVVKVNGVFKSFLPLQKFKVEHYEYSNVAHIDEYGGRLTAYAKIAAKNVVIPFLGDSFTFGVGVEDDKTFISILSAQSKIRYINLGVPGTNLKNHLDITELRHQELGSPPWYIFCFFLGNDLLYSPPDSHKDSILPSLKKINHFVYHHPFLKRLYSLQFIRAKLLILYNRTKLHKQMDPIFISMNKNNKLLLRKNIGIGLENQLQRLLDLSEKLRFKPLFILIPDYHQLSPAILKKKAQYYGIAISDIAPELPNKIVSEKLRKRNISCIDVTECLKNKKDNLYYTQDNHLNSAGHQVIAEYLQNFLTAYFSEIL